MCVFFLVVRPKWLNNNHDTVVSVNKCVLPFNVGIYRLLACCRRPLSFLYHYDVRSIEYFWMLQHLFCMLDAYTRVSEQASARASLYLHPFVFVPLTMASSQWTVRVVRITFADTIVSFWITISVIHRSRIPANGQIKRFSFNIPCSYTVNWLSVCLCVSFVSFRQASSRIAIFVHIIALFIRSLAVRLCLCLIWTVRAVCICTLLFSVSTTRDNELENDKDHENPKISYIRMENTEFQAFKYQTDNKMCVYDSAYVYLFILTISFGFYFQLCTCTSCGVLCLSS